MSKKRAVLIILLSMFALLSFASSALSWTGKRAEIPYITLKGDWWAGISIRNNTDTGRWLRTVAYDASGTVVASKNCHYVPAYGNLTDIIENFFDDALPDRVAVYVETMAASTNDFTVTMFMGRTQGNNQGFAFQTYSTADFESDAIYLKCGLIPPGPVPVL
ncbi:MAG: hypothetical protein D3926_06700 [Desulfobacteraceae bacterium]|nr:MAG: hypothetical protein D3926_06700 [Desulfobacteraceae bacterium]